ncbi:MAG: hypothetical protein SFV21_00400 [Rhodospirillaceae bacterium]|nr:hypothetical protein [Rhodospirillaceae bacterium]
MIARAVVVVLLSGLMHAGVVLAQPACPAHAPPAGLTRIAEVMTTGRFVAYQPTALHMVNGRATPADAASIAEDLKVLRPYFDGLITYGAHSGGERVADVAATLGFRAVIMGVWEIASAAERAAVVAAAKRAPGLVAGVSVGNEVVYGRRGTFADVAAAMRDLRAAMPDVAIAATEPFHVLLGPDARPALEAADLLLPIVHPVFEPWYKAAPDANAAEFVVNVTAELARVYCGPILVKETGVPTAPAELGFTPARQAAFYRELQRQFSPSAAKAFAYFSAFDAPWRVNDSHPVPGDHPEEAHWGLFDADRKPKPVAGVIAPLRR